MMGDILGGHPGGRGTSRKYRMHSYPKCRADLGILPTPMLHGLKSLLFPTPTLILHVMLFDT